MPVEWKLKELLEQHGLSVYALADCMGGGAGRGNAKRPNLYAITSADPDKRPTRVSFDLLSEMLTCLFQLTGRRYGISDVLSFSPDSEARRERVLESWEPPEAEVLELMVPRKRGRPPGSGRKKARAT